MHGEPLYKSGVRAARLLWANLMDAVALDTVADFIIVCAILLVILAALGEAVIIHEVRSLLRLSVKKIFVLGNRFTIRPLLDRASNRGRRMWCRRIFFHASHKRINEQLVPVAKFQFGREFLGCRGDYIYLFLRRQTHE